MNRRIVLDKEDTERLIEMSAENARLKAEVDRLRGMLNAAEAWAHMRHGINCHKCVYIKPLNSFWFCAECWQKMIDGEERTK